MQSHTSLKGMGPLLLEQIYMKKEIHILWRHCMVHVGGEYPFIQPLFLYTPWRVGTAREEKGWEKCFFRQIEPNGPLPYSNVPAPRLRDARPAGWVTYYSTYMREYNAETPKQGRKRFNSIAKTIHFSYLPIIYLWYTHWERRRASLLLNELITLTLQRGIFPHYIGPSYIHMAPSIFTFLAKDSLSSSLVSPTLCIYSFSIGITGFSDAIFGFSICITVFPTLSKVPLSASLVSPTLSTVSLSASLVSLTLSIISLVLSLNFSNLSLFSQTLSLVSQP